MYRAAASSPEASQLSVEPFGASRCAASGWTERFADVVRVPGKHVDRCPCGAIAAADNNPEQLHTCMTSTKS